MNEGLRGTGKKKSQRDRKANIFLGRWSNRQADRLKYICKNKF